jgi:hypothetical protein
MNRGKPAYPIVYFIAGLSCLGISSAAKADDMAYTAIGNGFFGTLDLNTGCSRDSARARRSPVWG